MLTPKFLKKKSQAARKVAIEKREIDCSKYYDDAYYDKQKRMDDIADATKRALDENAQSKKEAAEITQKKKLLLLLASVEQGFPRSNSKVLAHFQGFRSQNFSMKDREVSEINLS